jgi:hypothetical protein
VILLTDLVVVLGLDLRPRQFPLPRRRRLARPVLLLLLLLVIVIVIVIGNL